MNIYSYRFDSTVLLSSIIFLQVASYLVLFPAYSRSYEIVTEIYNYYLQLILLFIAELQLQNSNL